MNEQDKRITVSGNWSEQRRNKPPIEDVIFKHLDNKIRKTALDFIAWFRENKMQIAWNTWKVNYKGKMICRILLPDPKNHAGPDYAWVITLILDYKLRRCSNAI